MQFVSQTCIMCMCGFMPLIALCWLFLGREGCAFFEGLFFSIVCAYLIISDPYFRMHLMQQWMKTIWIIVRMGDGLFNNLWINSSMICLTLVSLSTPKFICYCFALSHAFLLTIFLLVLHCSLGNSPRQHYGLKGNFDSSRCLCWSIFS
jgi:hypothetical protein